MTITERIQKNKSTAFLVMGGLALLNVVATTIDNRRYLSDDPNFHLMNLKGVFWFFIFAFSMSRV